MVNGEWKNVVNAMCRDAIYRVLCEMKHFIYKTIPKSHHVKDG